MCCRAIKTKVIEGAVIAYQSLYLGIRLATGVSNVCRVIIRPLWIRIEQHLNLFGNGMVLYLYPTHLGSEPWVSFKQFNSTLSKACCCIRKVLTIWFRIMYYIQSLILSDVRIRLA